MIIEHNYLKGGFFKDLKSNIKYRICKKMVLCIDIIGEHSNVQNKDYYDRREYWTDTPKEILHENGYRICEGIHDNLAWFGVPVMMKIYNFKIPECTDPNFSQDTPSTLNDRMNNNLMNKFAKSLARAAAIAGIDIQKMILIAAVGIGAIVGMKMFGVF